VLNPATGTDLQQWHPAGFDVVSVQSQVVYGRVGNNVAVPILQQHGFAVAAVPTVLLSNTPHYPSVHGGVISADWLRGFLDDLGQRGALQRLRAVLVGYLGHPEQAAVLADWLRRLRQDAADVLIVVDPVIGDHDVGTYVHPDLVDAYRRDLLPLATGLTPNGYELAQLTGMPVNHQDEVRQAAQRLLTTRQSASLVLQDEVKRGSFHPETKAPTMGGAEAPTAKSGFFTNHTQWVVVTSAAPVSWPPMEMQTMVVTAADAITIHHPRMQCQHKGTGDLFAASLTAHLLQQTDLPEAATQAASQVLAVLEETCAVGCGELVLSAG